MAKKKSRIMRVHPDFKRMVEDLKVDEDNSNREVTGRLAETLKTMSLGKGFQIKVEEDDEEEKRRGGGLEPLF